ncbi:protein eva-1 homolog C [Chanos chanos]|uniref:Protein eva-1 homolog C n=1 Tax=Chanos chanos TaxID=29144 RepID=A0A6J2WXQ8_CHACN|nr:protein eva-1 homolog C [Chanos chanos]
MISAEYMTCFRTHRPKCLVQILGVLLLWTKEVDGLADFSSYLSKIINSHSSHAYDGDLLLLRCPRHSTISIQSAFYGQTELRGRFGSWTPSRCKRDYHRCSAPAAFQKMLSECQGRRDCQLLVNHHAFGLDPCPGTPKHLHVTYKCKPTEHKEKVGCEGERLLLHCKHPKALVIYAAVYGRRAGEDSVCISERKEVSPFDCLYYGAVDIVTKLCYGRQRCFINVDNQHFRDPCSPGTTKHLTVFYSCVPQTLLKEADPNVFRTTSTPRQSTAKEELPAHPISARSPEKNAVVVSNYLMTYGYIKENLEMTALLFVSSVCMGLMLTLLAVSVKLSCSRGLNERKRTSRRTIRRNKSNNENDENDENDDDDDDDDSEDEGSDTVMDSSLLSEVARKVHHWEELTYTTEAAELMERIERRDLVIQEIWMNAYLNGTPC